MYNFSFHLFSYLLFLCLTASKKAAEIIHKDLRSLHPMLLTSLDDIGRSQARKLLEQLQVKCVTSQDLIKHHIIPSLIENQKQIVNNFNYY